jgi:hypothetical protein
MTRSRTTLSAEVRDASVIFTKELFLGILKGMLKSKELEEQYVALQIQVATEKQLDEMAQRAAEYYVDHTNPSPANLSRAEINKIKKAAIDYALGQ